ncbi:hypothetical protein OAU50_04500 [Planctomycetota bacterium]|nr:hypothetical protein [Planctomycetota bacterium]
MYNQQTMDELIDFVLPEEDVHEHLKSGLIGYMQYAVLNITERFAYDQNISAIRKLEECPQWDSELLGVVLFRDWVIWCLLHSSNSNFVNLGILLRGELDVVSRLGIEELENSGMIPIDFTKRDV